MARIGAQPHRLGVGVIHHEAHFLLALDRAPDVRMRRQLHAHGDGLLAQPVQGIGQALELFLAGATGRACAHVDFPVTAAHRHQEVAAEGDMVGDGLGDLVGVDEVGGLALLAV